MRFFKSIICIVKENINNCILSNSLFNQVHYSSIMLLTRDKMFLNRKKKKLCFSNVEGKI